MNFNRQRGGRGSITHQQQKNKLQNHNSGIGLINQLFADHFNSVKIKELTQSELIQLKKSVENGCLGGK